MKPPDSLASGLRRSGIEWMCSETKTAPEWEPLCVDRLGTVGADLYSVRVPKV